MAALAQRPPGPAVGRTASQIAAPPAPADLKRRRNEVAGALAPSPRHPLALDPSWQSTDHRRYNKGSCEHTSTLLAKAMEEFVRSLLVQGCRRRAVFCGGAVSNTRTNKLATVNQQRRETQASSEFTHALREGASVGVSRKLELESFFMHDSSPRAITQQTLPLSPPHTLSLVVRYTPCVPRECGDTKSSGG